MDAYLSVFAALLLTVNGAPPSPPRLYAQHAPAQLQQENPLEYYLQNADIEYYQPQQKQANVNSNTHGAPSRLETLEPDSEVELIPGVQPPQQPPQQTPVAPHIPGLVPGQRVFIVHMPVPGYRPGTIGGYQPVYIVAAAPQGNNLYPGNGYQNAVFLNPSGQVVSPVVYNRPGVAPVVQNNQGVLLGAPFSLNRPYNLAYSGEQVYQQVPAHGADVRGAVRLSQLVGLQAQPVNHQNNPRPNVEQTVPEPARQTQAVEGNEKENLEDQRRVRPALPQTVTHAQIRKA